MKKVHKIEVKNARSYIRKMLGLMFTRKDKISPIMLETRFGIHSFGLLASIDILILDQSYNVAALKQGLRPCSLFFWPPKYKIVIELPEGYISKNKIKTGDRVKLIETF